VPAFPGNTSGLRGFDGLKTGNAVPAFPGNTLSPALPFAWYCIIPWPVRYSIRAGVVDSAITVLGATGKVGRALVASLARGGQPVVAVGRDRAKLAALDAVETRVADFDDAEALTAALAEAERVVSCAHARFVVPLLAALPARIARLVLMGSARKFTRFSDEKAEAVRAGEKAYLASGRPGVMVHPTMIYGIGAENNIERVAVFIRRFGVVPLPRGGRSLIQPIHLDDVVRVLEGALDESDGAVSSLVLAGPEAVPYRALIEAIGRAIGRRVRILPVPAALLLAASRATALVPGLPTISPGEVRRLLEDKDFDISEMLARFGFEPLSLDAGLARSFGTGA